MRHVHAAIQEMFNTSHVLIIKTASRLERLLLAALHLEARFSGRWGWQARTVLTCLLQLWLPCCGG